MSIFDSTIFSYIWLIIGFVCLVKGADFFVDGSSSIAKILKVPSIIIGLTIVAMGTSLPEASVSISAAISNANGIAVGNVIGSNFFNLLFVIGMCALFHPVHISRDIVKRDFPFSIAITVILLGFVYIGSHFAIDDMADFGIARFSGFLLLLLFVIYISVLVQSAIRSRQLHTEDDENTLGPVKSIVLIIVGAIAIIAGGNLVVDSAKVIAASFGMSETLIGLTIVALGTSLPELVTSIVAAKKGDTDMALGNVIGSNIFNILFVLGASASVHAIELGASGIESIIDLILLIISSLIVLIIAIKSESFRFKSGLLMIIMYGAYLAYIIARNYNMLPF